MALRDDIREFLTTRRARLTPEQVGLPAHGRGHRRVPGLRREEVALLAGVSIDYYIRLERGSLAGASDAVLESLADALQLDEAERAHLRDLASQSGSRRRTPTTRSRPRASLDRVLLAITDAPAMIRSARREVLAANDLGRALYTEVLERPDANLAAYTFLDPRARRFFRQWERSAADLVAALRIEVGRTPHDPDLTGLIGELCAGSPDFARLWAAHDVRLHRNGTKLLHHPVVGDLDLEYESMELPADPGLSLVVYTAPPGTPTADALHLLASWAAPDRAADTPITTERI